MLYVCAAADRVRMHLRLVVRVPRAVPRPQLRRLFSTAAAGPISEPVKLAFVEYPITGEQPAASQRSSSLPPLVIVHGLLGSSTNWRSFVQRPELRLGGSGRRVLGVDLRNHGSSPHSDRSSLRDLAADLNQFLVDQNIERAAILGHSLGGKAAMLLSLLYPSRVDRLIVADIAPVSYIQTNPSWTGVASVVHALGAVDLTTINSRAAADKAVQHSIPDKNVRAFALANLTVNDTTTATTAAVTTPPTAYKWRANLPVLIRSLPEYAAFPDPNSLHSDESAAAAAAAAAGPNAIRAFSGRTLFLGGAKSTYVAPAHHATIRRFFPAAAIESIAGAGHWLHVERPAQTATAIGDFLTAP